ncbi:hypothetical protein F4809DRAFT_45318 [Biscogniauxia mediterranea]|nr:hypothetical protein F4809DRAFT_45318 [Biscogniauxia mediterranea]
MAAPYREQLIKHCAEAANSICDECVLSSTTSGGSDGGGSSSPLAACGPALVDLLSRQAHGIRSSYGECELAMAGSAAALAKEAEAKAEALTLRRLEDLASIAYAKFYAFLYKDLPVCWRQLYTDARILKFCLLVLRSPYGPRAGAEEAGAATKEVADDQGNDDDAEEEDDDDEEGKLCELVETLDLALILAGAAGELRGRRWIDAALELLRLACIERGAAAATAHGGPTKRAKSIAESLQYREEAAAGEEGEEDNARTFSTDEPFTPPVKHPIRRVPAPSMEDFQTHLDRAGGPQPLVMRGAIGGAWPALTTRRWDRPSYLLSRTFGGRRLVPVEVGRSYVDEGWGQRLVTFGAFLREYIDPSLSSSSPPRLSSPSAAGGGPTPIITKPIAYLAQHPLLTQLPALRADILVPDYCYTSPPPPSSSPRDAAPPPPPPPPLDEPLLNAWLGPPGTITPLHTDPYHNVLAQVVGRKYVRLYAAAETPRMAARGREAGVEMGNTSRVDVGVAEGWDSAAPLGAAGDEDGDEDDDDKEQRKLFAEIPFVDCILEPGDLLYIPAGWWHYVRGLSVSFSVSFWWN